MRVGEIRKWRFIDPTRSDESFLVIDIDGEGRTTILADGEILSGIAIHDLDLVSDLISEADHETG
jgi:hypothetical protein